MIEEWRNIPEFVGIYQASSLGNIRTVKRAFRTPEGRTGGVKQTILKKYKRDNINVVNLVKGKKTVVYPVFKLIASAFLGTSGIVYHIDGNYFNDAASNLTTQRQYGDANERWADILGWEGLYQVSNKGRVRSLDRYSGVNRVRFCKGRILAPFDSHGYLQINLYHSGNSLSNKTYQVHRLVGQAFIPNPENLPQINHKDGNKKNNVSDNLEWCTAQYNVIHAYDTGLNSREQARINMYKASLASAELSRIKCKCIETGQIYDSYTQAAQLNNTSPTEIKFSCDKHSCHRGLHFCRLDDEYSFGVKDIPNEKWIDVPGFEGLYMYSNMNRVKSIQRTCKSIAFGKPSSRVVPEKLIVLYNNKASLSNNGKRTDYDFTSLFRPCKKLFEID